MLITIRSLLPRMMVSWVGVSLVVGGAVTYYGTERTDEQLVNFAVSESAKLTAASLDLINGNVADRAALERHVEEFVRGRFVAVEIFNRSHQRVLGVVDPQQKEIEDYVKENVFFFPPGDVPQHERFTVADQSALQVMVPLKDAAGSIVGYFEGIIVIDPATLESLRRDLIVTLAIALCAVLLTTLVLCPVVMLLNRQVAKFTGELLRGNVELMEVLGSAIAKRDSDDSVIHNYRVSIYAVRLAEAARLDADAIRKLITGAFLHDVGKIGISDKILLKPAKLSEAEFEVMKTHVSVGADIMAKSNWLKSAGDVVEFHHEKFNGTGYMRGLKGEAIPINARILAIVDVFDSLMAKRTYKEAMSFDQAMEIMHRDSGSHFDPRLTGLFEGIAAPLYQEVGAATDEAIEKILRVLIAKYFFAGQSA